MIAYAMSDDAAAGTRTTGERGSASLVALGILLSRIAGLVRERVFAHYFGSSMAAGAFKAALRIPNALQNLFGEGVLSGSFIPVYARLLETDETLANRVAGVVASLLALFVSVVVVLGVLLSGPLVSAIAPGFTGETRELTVTIVRILFPGMGILVLSAWCLGILNSHRKFFVSYSAPVLWSLAMIVAMVLFGSRVETERLAIVLAWATVIGSVLQFTVQVPFVLRCARGLRLGIDRALEPVRRVFRNAIPIVLGRGVVQISAFVDEIIASFLGAAAVAGIAYAQTLYLLPVSLFGMSVAAAELPEMSRATGSAEDVARRVRERLTKAQRRVAFLVVPSAVALLSIGSFLVGGLFETGAFGRDETLFVTYILCGSAIGLLAATLGRLYSSAFYAMGDTKTPLRFAIVRVAATAVLGVAFAFPLRPAIVSLLRDVLQLPVPEIERAELALGAVGITIASGIAAWIEWSLLRRAIRARVGEIEIGSTFLAKVCGAALLAGGASAAFGFTLADQVRSALPTALGLHQVGTAVVVAGVFGVVYLTTAWLMKMDEVRYLGR
jgi:putative peptidoglycan lipid II flippase